MAYRLRFPDGLMLEVDSADELQTALRLARSPVPVNEQPPILNNTIPLGVNHFRQFVRSVRGRQRIILTHLATSPQGLRDADLHALLGIDSNIALSGTMAGLSKNARRVNLTLDQILTKERRDNGGGRHYIYTMTEPMRQIMNNHR